MIAINYCQPTTVIHGANDDQFDLVGISVCGVRIALRDAFNVPSDAIAMVDGVQVGSGHRLRGGETLEFCKPSGRKGVLEPIGDPTDEASETARSIVAKLREHEQRLAAIEQRLSSGPIEAAELPFANTMAMRNSPYLDSTEAAAYIGVSVSSLYGMVERRHLKPLRGPKRTYRFTTAMLDEYLARTKK